LTSDIRPKALATIGSGALGPVLDQSLRTFRRFGARHGYDVVVGAGTEAGGRAPAWAKIPLIRRLLDVYAVVLWVDADAIILDDSVDPLTVVAPGSYQALVKHRWMGQEQPCTGVWLLRSTDRAKALLDALWADDRYAHEHPWEQAALMALLGYESIAPGIPGRPTCWTQGTQWLDGEWDEIPILTPGRELGPCRIRHYAANPNAVRRNQMRSDLHQIAAREGSGIGAAWHGALAGAGRARWRLVYATELPARARAMTRFRLRRGGRG
jgi:hypothetical protein